MKASTVLAVVAGLVASTSAQLSDIPTCALTCAISSLGSTGCSQTDIKCICSSTGFVAALTPCVEKACSAADLQKTITAAEGLCQSAGVSLSIPPIAATTSAAAVTTSAAVTTTSVAVVTTSSTLTSSVVVVVSNTTTTGAASAPTGNTTAVTTGLPSATPTGNAATRNGAAMGGLAVVLAFAAALL